MHLHAYFCILISMRSFKTEGIVIRRRNVNDADRILTIFTKEYGKIHVKAAGVRKITSRRSSHVELLNHTVFGLYKGSGLFVLTEAQTLSPFSGLKSDLQRIGSAYHLCELIDGLCPEHQELKAVFQLFCKTLYMLCASNEITDIINTFEIDLLTLLGYWDQRQGLADFDTSLYIENILERRLKARKMFSRI